MNDYDPIQKAQDATAFAKSRFGQHYLTRLATVRDDHYSKARSLVRNGAPSEQAAVILARADEVQSEIEWFRQAELITTDKRLMDKIRDSLRRKEKRAE